jgi:hypothetical protein
MTALGSQEWFTNATVGDTHIPMGASECDVKVKVFVVNYIS